MSGRPAVHPQALRDTADTIWDVWTAYTDTDLSVMARETAHALRRLAERIERGR